MVGILVGCAATPTPDPWQGIEVETRPTTTPLVLPVWPLPVEFTEDKAVFDLEGVRALEAYRVAAGGNTEIAAAHADQIDDLRTATKALVDAGKAQRKVADLRLEILEEERRHWMFEKISYWAGFLIIGLGVAL